MKAGFALDITDEGLGLLHRTSQGWMPLGEARFDDPALAETLGFLRGTAAALAPGGVTTKLILPESQVLYTRVKAPGSARETKRKNIRSALEGLTPYAVEDLVFDFVGSGEEVQVAVVARETLEEAEAFANEHRLNPISFVARPDEDKFDGEPFFGPTQRAADFMPKGAKVEADKAVVKILAAKSAFAVDAAPEPAVADEEVLPSVGNIEQRIDPEVGRVSEANAEPVVETPLAETTPAEAHSQLRFGLPADASEGLTAGVLSPAVNLPEDVAEAPAATVKDDAERSDSAAMPFISRRGGDDASGNQGAGIADVVAKMGERAEPAASVVSDAAVTATGSDAIAKAARPAIGETVGKMPSSIDADKPKIKSVVPPAPPVRPSNVGAALPSGVTAPVRRRVDAPHAAAERATRKPTEARRDGFGSARGTPERGKPRYMGLILTTALLAALLLAALLSSFLLPRDSEPQVAVPVGTDNNSTGAPNAVTPDAQGDAAAAPDATAPDATGADTQDVVPPSDGPAPTPADEAAADGQEPETAVDPALIAPEVVPSQPAEQNPAPDSSISSSNTRVGLTLPADEAGADPATEAVAVQTDLSPLAEAGGPPAGQAPDDPGGGALPENVPLAVATSAPAVPDAPDQEALDNLVLSNVDPDVLSEETTRLPETVAADAIIAVPETAAAPEPSAPVVAPVQTAAVAVAEPVTPAALAPVAAPALVVATPEGAITPDGIRVIAGRPDVVPPVRPEAIRIAAATASAAATRTDAINAALVSEAAEAPNPLADKRPTARPVSLAPNDDGAALTQGATSTGPRPNARPATIVAAASAAPPVAETPLSAPEAADPFVDASKLAVAISRVPVARPRVFAAAIDAAVASAAAEPAVAAVPAPEPEPQPEAIAAAPEELAEPEAEVAAVVAPSRGSVAKTATIANALNLSKLNLIGVYGSPKNRRALLRTSTGRYVKVEIGDRIEGGKVAAIGDNELSYVKNGRTVVLKMLRDS